MNHPREYFGESKRILEIVEEDFVDMKNSSSESFSLNVVSLKKLRRGLECVKELDRKEEESAREEDGCVQG